MTMSIVCPVGNIFAIALKTPVLQDAFRKDPEIATICMASVDMVVNTNARVVIMMSDPSIEALCATKRKNLAFPGTTSSVKS
jgi:hypothetical protein